MTKYDVICVGSATVDTFVFSDVEEHRHNGHVEMCYIAGSKILIKKIYFKSGGSGTNTAVGFKRMGLRSAFLGKMGAGNNSNIVMEDLNKERVPFLGIRDKNVHTGYSVILDSEGKDRTILTFKGANDELRYNEVKLNGMDTKWFYFGSMLGESFETIEKLAEYAGKKGIKIAYNPSIYQAERGAKYLGKILRNTDVLVLNKEEAEALSGDKGDKVFSKLRSFGPRIVCVTDGENGSKVFDGEHLYISHVHKVKCVEKTGAGDAFASGFVSAIIKGRDIETAINIGNVNAESVIQHIGAKKGLLTWGEAESIIKKKPVKIEKVIK